MLDDMPKSHGVTLAPQPEDAIATMIGPPAKRRGRRVSLGRGREKVVHSSALGMLLRPIGIAVGIVLCVYAIVSLGTTFYRSYYRHLDHTAPVHADKSVLDIVFGEQSLPPDAVDLVIKDVDGSLHTEESDGLRAVCHQHEIDQLDGIFWIRRLSRLKRERLIKRFDKGLRN